MLTAAENYEYGVTVVTKMITYNIRKGPAERETRAEE
jgi:hypothetical protein